MFKLKLKLLLSSIALVFCGVATLTTTQAQTVLIESLSSSGTGGLDGSSAVVDASYTAAGGSATWVAAANFSADGSVDDSSGASTAAHIDIGDVINNAKGTANGLFELTVTMEIPTGTGNVWYSIGFCQQDAPATGANFLALQGIASIILRGSGELDMWAGNGFTPNGLGPSGNSNPIDGEVVEGTQTLTVQVDVRSWNGVDNFGKVNYLDSTGALLVGGTPNVAGGGTFNYTNTPIFANTGELGSIPTDPDFASILITEANGTIGSYTDLTLTQITAGGLVGDFDDNGVVDCADIDQYIGKLGMSSSGTLADFDLVVDGTIDLADVEFLVTNLVVTSNGQTGTFLGDMNCDGQVNVLGDAFILVANLGNTVTSYSQGDINLDGTVNVLRDAFGLVANLGMSNAL